MVYYNNRSTKYRNYTSNWRRNRITNKNFKNRRTQKSSFPQTRRSRNRTSTIGSFMKTAATSIISAIPGSSILKGVADFIFKAVKVVSTVDAEQGYQMIPATEAIIGLNQILVLKRVHFIMNSPEIRVLPGVPTSKTPEEQKKHIRDQYIAYNMKEITIELKPQNDVGSRQGQWAMVFIPFVSQEQEEDLSLDYKNTYVGYNDILRIDGSVNGPQTQSLRIKYSPQAHDGRAFLAGSSDDNFGILIIAYQDFAKASTTEFTPQDFAATLLTSSVVRKLNRRSSIYTIVSVLYDSWLAATEEFRYDGHTMYIVTNKGVETTAQALKGLTLSNHHNIIS